MPRTAALKFKPIISEEGKYVILHIDSDNLIIKALPPHWAKTLVRVHSDRNGSCWHACGYGQRGWTNAIWNIARELHRRAEAASKREPRQYNLFGSADDKSTADAIASVKEHLFGDEPE